MIIQEIKDTCRLVSQQVFPPTEKLSQLVCSAQSGGTAPSPTSKSLLSISEISHFNLSKIDFGKKNVAFEVLFQLYAGTHKGLHGDILHYITSLY